jgi:hypothetical protein
MVGPGERPRFLSNMVLCLAYGFYRVCSCEKLKLTLMNAHFILLHVVTERGELFRYMFSTTVSFKDEKYLNK